MSSNAVALRPRATYAAKRVCVLASGREFLISGTLDGFLDFCITDADGVHATRVITCDEARALAAGLLSAVADVQANCLFDRDALLMKGAAWRTYNTMHELRPAFICFRFHSMPAVASSSSAIAHAAAEQVVDLPDLPHQPTPPEPARTAINKGD